MFCKMLYRGCWDHFKVFNSFKKITSWHYGNDVEQDTAIEIQLQGKKPGDSASV